MSLQTTLRTLRQSTRLQHGLFQTSRATFPLAKAFSTSCPNKKLMDTSNPASNIPDPHPNSSAAPNAKVRSDSQHTDQQSSASRDEGKQGDEHPAKQPDFQAQPERTTGIGGGEQVKGGKEGLGERT
ncbi:hypothetical protein COCVIDRAFT_37612 [Bipolaris victoriae FI3]|uniref:Uncharacterized protein n=1 Tax=Bipolaris victoriae (strain FI3) TaxID=930091 RepID=W7EGB1_BIPV3|nr:hypothetical protein COCVIDRAFT_37612 [Bipolaris victoriae FI3]